MDSSRKKALQIFSVYFSALFGASLLISATVLPEEKLSKIIPQEALVQALASGASLQLQVHHIEIAHKDLTGLKQLVTKKRKAEERRAAQAEARAARQAYADQHPGRFSNAAFVAADPNIPVLPIELRPEMEEGLERARIREQINAVATRYIGVPYVWAGKTPKGFDCSGFTSFVMAKFGISITGSSRHQAVLGKTIPVKEAQTGDLIFFSRYGKGGMVTHVALVMDNNNGLVKIIHANGPGIMVENLFESKYWIPKILHAKNIIDAI